MNKCKRCNKPIHTTPNKNVPEEISQLQGICYNCLTDQEKQTIQTAINNNKDMIFQTEL